MTEFICCFCESEMDFEQVVCCDTYKGKMTIDEFEMVYGYTFVGKRLDLADPYQPALILRWHR